ncbi:MAG: hypothetical protein M3404_13915 [Actinomycetota bacterium]|nr:hypothetical protein [Actinomycetota bacterium]
MSATGAVQVTNEPAPLRSHSSPQIAVNPRTGDESDSGSPGWTLLLTGLFGLGLGVAVAWLLMRRRDAEPAAAPRGTPSRA